MAEALHLSRREAEVLDAALRLYFAEGVPVSSKAMAERRDDGLSAATLRNVLAELEESGFMRQPHTSAGRIPTPRAIRWWLQQLRAQPELTFDGRALELERALLDAGDEAAVWREASHFLSEVSRQMGLAAIPPRGDAGLRNLRLVRLAERRVLAVLLGADGQSRERLVRLPEAWSQTELDQAARYINQHFTGWTLARIRHELRQRLAEDRLAYDTLLKRVTVLAHCGALALDDEGEVFIDGAGHLAAGLEPAQLAGMLSTLMMKERWLQLLSHVEAGEAGEVVEIEGPPAEVGRRLSLRIAVDLEQAQLPGMSLVSTRCGQGAIAILGPLRMEYPTALRTIALVGDMISRVLGEN